VTDEWEFAKGAGAAADDLGFGVVIAAAHCTVLRSGGRSTA